LGRWKYISEKYADTLLENPKVIRKNKKKLLFINTRK